MKEIKTVGFDILDNARLDQIDEISTDIDMLDKMTKKRILEMTKKRFNDAIKGENIGIDNIMTDENAEVVENVEVYNRSKIRKIMTGVVNTAAVVGLAAGSVFLVKNISRGDIDKPVESDLPAVSSTESTKATENLTPEEIECNKCIDELIKNIYISHNIVLDKDTFDDTLKIEYAYMDINNDSVSELFIRYNLLDSIDFKGIKLNFFDGTEYIPLEDIGYTAKFDLNNRKLYELSEGYEREYWLDIKTWENIELFSDTELFTLTDNYYSALGPFSGSTDEIMYFHNNEQCTEEEFNNTLEEYDNLVDAELKYIPYIPDESLFIEKSANNTINGSSASDLSQEDKARNKRIEEYIEYLYYYCDGESDKNKFYDDIKIDYAYLDINNDSVSELLIRYHNLNDFTPYYEGTEINYFDGTKYIPFGEMNTTFKFDLKNHKLYQLSESHEGGYSLYIRTWQNSDLSDDVDFFSLQDDYHSNIVDYESIEYIYTHNDEEITKEEYEKAMDQYEKFVGAEVNYIPYN